MYLLCSISPPPLVGLALNVEYTSELNQKFQVTSPWLASFKEMATYTVNATLNLSYKGHGELA